MQVWLGVWTSGHLWAANPAADAPMAVASPARVSFEVAVPPGLRNLPHDSRLLVVLASPGRGEPKDSIGKLGAQAPTLLGVDVPAGTKAATLRLGEGAAVFPWRVLGEMPVGSYAVQAVLMTNRDLWFPGAPGNPFSPSRTVTVDVRCPRSVVIDVGPWLSSTVAICDSGRGPAADGICRFWRSAIVAGTDSAWR